MKSNAFDHSDEDDDSADIVDETMRYLLLNGGLVAEPDGNEHLTNTAAVGSSTLEIQSSLDENDPAAPSSSKYGVLSKSLLNNARKIVAWSPKNSKAEGQHYDFLAMATLPTAVDHVIQSIQYNSSRRVIMQAILRTASIIAADELIFSTGGEQTASSASRQGFVDEEGRSLSEVMLHACVLIIVNADCVEERGLLDEDSLDEIIWIIRWLSNFSLRAGFASVASLVVAFCVLLYCDTPSSSSSSSETQRALRRLLENYRQLYSCYADATSTINDFHKYFVPDCVSNLRRAIAELTSSNKVGTLFNGKVKGVCFSRFRAAVAPFVHALDNAEYSEGIVRGFLVREEMLARSALLSTANEEAKMLRFNQAWFEAFNHHILQEELARAEIEEEGAVIPPTIVAKKLAMEILWRETLWETEAIFEREATTRRQMQSDILRKHKAMIGAFQIELATNLEQQLRGEQLMFTPEKPAGVEEEVEAAVEATPVMDDAETNTAIDNGLQPAVVAAAAVSPTPVAPLYRALSRGSAELRYQQQRRSRNSSSIGGGNLSAMSATRAAAEINDDEGDDDDHHQQLPLLPAASPPPEPRMASSDVEIEELIEREMMVQMEREEMQVLAEQFEQERWVRYYWTISGDRKPIGTRRVFVPEMFSGKAADRHLPDKMRSSSRIITRPPFAPSPAASPRVVHDRQPSAYLFNTPR